MQASSLEDLQVKLENESYMNVSFIVVNHQGEDSRAKYHDLKRLVPENIPVYQQDEGQADVWTLLNGRKNDFFIYDRCGRLMRHIGLPFAFLQFHYVEDAIKQVYCDSTCGECEHEIPSDVCKKEETPTVAKTDEEPGETIQHPRNPGKHHQEKEAVAEDSNRPNVHAHKKHHHHHHHRHHKAEGCQTLQDGVAERAGQEGKVVDVPDRAAEVEGQNLEKKL
ncbi:hypothetical protein GDO81_002763 [Engystomops pustulosus]|uniref:Selenoprotein P N-terminal domain-containing protein n=1 Tax=Engystomops pustulosus TaxID=76066 RepID=A0AAV7DPG1_ENGPU|nr:hypothetical protein GDO81_002763 [Engystomops pustulosus]